MNIASIKEMVKDGKKVRFTHYQKGNLVYETECGFEFYVPIDDVGDAAFLAEDKATYFMRWIRKHMKMIDEGKKECENL